MSDQGSSEKTEKPEQILDDIDNRLDNIHRILANEAAEVGRARDAIRIFARPQVESWVNLINSGTIDQETTNIYKNNIDLLATVRDEVRSRESQFLSKPGLFGPTSGSVGIFITATATTSSFFPITSTPPFEHMPLLASGQHEIYATRFSKLDPSLGKIYQAIREVRYGTRADPERGALYLMRQAFDQFFDILAPDGEVRKSQFWIEKKEKGKEQHVWRREKIQFAATKIKDIAQRATLASSAKHMLSVYEELNRAHERGQLDQAKACTALAEMQSILEIWVTAISDE